MKYLLFIITILFATEANGQFEFLPENRLPERDTIPVVMLVSDTPFVKMTLTLLGYSVRERYNRNKESNGDWHCIDCKDYMRHSYYLNLHKDPLGKSFIVWMSVPAKEYEQQKQQQ